MEAQAVRLLLQDIREMKKKLEEMERELVRMIAESEEPEIIGDELHGELLRKAEGLRENPEDGMSVDEAVEELME